MKLSALRGGACGARPVRKNILEHTEPRVTLRNPSLPEDWFFLMRELI